MLDFIPLESLPSPENEVIMVQLVDDRYCFGICVADIYDADWVVQLPFEDPMPISRAAIKSWSKLPEHQQDRLKPRYGD